MQEAILICRERTILNISAIKINYFNQQIETTSVLYLLCILALYKAFLVHNKIVVTKMFHAKCQ